MGRTLLSPPYLHSACTYWRSTYAVWNPWIVWTIKFSRYHSAQLFSLKMMYWELTLEQLLFLRASATTPGSLYLRSCTTPAHRQPTVCVLGWTTMRPPNSSIFFDLPSLSYKTRCWFHY